MPLDVLELIDEKVRSVGQSIGIVEASPPQKEAIPLILKGENVLVVAPTGSGKTEAALLPILSKLVTAGIRGRLRLIYVTPLRALNRDILRRVTLWCDKLGLKVAVRHGDTTLSERRRLVLSPPDIMITTPETLQAMLASPRMRKNLSDVEFVVVDEVHELIESRRGIQLSVGLERLLLATSRPFQVVGLSATVQDPKLAASVIFGKREVRVTDITSERRVDFQIELPLVNAGHRIKARDMFISPEAVARLDLLASLVRSHRAVLIFVNSRTLAEMLSSRLRLLNVEVGVHHGSLPREERERVEEDFKKGRINAIVCTSTLELGIDIGSVDLVIQYMSPRQVTSLVQRVGRSGHTLGGKAQGHVITVTPEDVVESEAIIALAREGRLERIITHKGSLDVLAHQAVGFALERGEYRVDEFLELLNRTYAYADFSRGQLEDILAFLSGKGKLRFDDEIVSPGRGSRKYYFENLSMIPDEKRYLVIDMTSDQAVGILGEEFVTMDAQIGMNIILKGRVWKLQSISRDGKVFVTPVEDPVAAIPGWDGELIPVSREVAERVGVLRRKLLEGSYSPVSSIDGDTLSMAKNELQAQERSTQLMPSDRQIVFEIFAHYLVVHVCGGDTVNRALGYVLEEALHDAGLTKFWWSDPYRILFDLSRRPETDEIRAAAGRVFDGSLDTIQALFNSNIAGFFPFGYYVKFIAQRFGLLPRGSLVSEPLYGNLSNLYQKTPVMQEAIREVLSQKVDLQGLWEVVERVHQKSIEYSIWESKGTPSPLALHILNRYGELAELTLPEHASDFERMREALEVQVVELICFACGSVLGPLEVREIPDNPRCRNCGSGLLSPSFWSATELKRLVEKRLRAETSTDEERQKLAKGRQAADLVLSYGKRAIFALGVYGIGPQTASRVLAKMHGTDEDFYKDLIAAKVKFVTTRPFWDDR
ncbi:MAG: DEAD/DEAH box helicase [Thaumarchaeota archaeon]|nr:DEAD/DEAH box helicase [Nitrososphaerota archaeon]